MCRADSGSAGLTTRGARDLGRPSGGLRCPRLQPGRGERSCSSSTSRPPVWSRSSAVSPGRESPGAHGSVRVLPP
jgi:hypothetical protein